MITTENKKKINVFVLLWTVLNPSTFAQTTLCFIMYTGELNYIEVANILVFFLYRSTNILHFIRFAVHCQILQHHNQSVGITMERLNDSVQYLESFSNQLRGFACSLRTTITYFEGQLKTNTTMTNKTEVAWWTTNALYKKIYITVVNTVSHSFGSFSVVSVVGNVIEIKILHINKAVMYLHYYLGLNKKMLGCI